MQTARLAQVSGSQAAQLHVAIATIHLLQNHQREVDRQIEQKRLQQDRADALGVSIPDPLAIERLNLESRDASIQLTSQLKQSREQLAVLIDKSIACRYIPESLEPPEDEPVDKCQLIELAIQSRCDLRALKLLRSRLSEDNLDVARWASDLVAENRSVPVAAVRGVSVLTKLIPGNAKAKREELELRRRQLDQAIKALQVKVEADVAGAVETGRSPEAVLAIRTNGCSLGDPFEAVECVWRQSQTDAG